MLNIEEKLDVLEGQDIWRYASLQPRLVWIDYRVSFLGLIYLLDVLNLTLLYTFLITIIVLYIIEKAMGLSLPSAMRKLHVFIIGSNRNPYRLERQSKYYG